jgi:hypothetical protein
VKRWVFSLDRNVVRHDIDLRAGGRLFQIVGAANEKERRPEADLMEGIVS